jgi:hypothetical protein
MVYWSASFCRADLSRRSSAKTEAFERRLVRPGSIQAGRFLPRKNTDSHGFGKWQGGGLPRHSIVGVPAPPAAERLRPTKGCMMAGRHPQPSSRVAKLYAFFPPFALCHLGYDYAKTIENKGFTQSENRSKKNQKIVDTLL